MSTTRTRGILTAATAVVLAASAVGGTAAAQATGTPVQSAKRAPPPNSIWAQQTCPRAVP